MLLERIKQMLRPVVLSFRSMVHRQRWAATVRKKNAERGAQLGFISFAPDLPRQRAAIYKICEHLNWAVEVNSAARKTSLTMYWPQSEDVFSPGPPGWINSSCVDINKRTVARAYRNAFGVDYSVNPTRHSGPVVRKSDRNAKHDGIIIVAPAVEESEYVYLRVINNQHGEEVQDIRVLWMRGVLPFVYLKYRPIADRFSNTNLRVNIAEINNVISDTEIEYIRRMCEEIGMDYGEIDALRDVDDGRLYIVDMNRTPYGPPNGLSAGDELKAIREMATEFRRRFMHE